MNILRHWSQNMIVLTLLCLLVPPVGLMFLWIRKKTRTLHKIYVSTVLAILTVVHLFAFYDLGVEMAGSSDTLPFFRFYDSDDHYKTIETARSRTTQEARTASTSDSIYWTDYRGPNRDGVYDQQPIQTNWRGGRLPELWRQTIGGGYASVIVAQGHIYTIEQRRKKEVVTAYDLTSGIEVWSHEWNALFQERLGGDGPRATPTWHKGKIYALGATGELRVLDAQNGRLLWKTNILIDSGVANLTWAMSASPLIVDDKVITLPGGHHGRSVAAYNKNSGELAWQSLDDNQAYVAPMVATVAGKRQLLIVSSKRLMGLNVEDGSLLWEYPWRTEMGINCTQPIVVDDKHIFISAGYGQGSALVRITARDKVFKVEKIWSNNRMKSKFNTPVLHENHVYGLDEGILQAIDVRTGIQKWKGGRYGYGQILLANGHLIISTEKGEVALVKATPEGHEELAKFTAIRGKTWNNPAIADGKLIVRNQTEMVCYDLTMGL